MKKRLVCFLFIISSLYCQFSFASDVEERVKVLMGKGVSEFMKGNYKQAIDFYNQADTLLPNNIHILGPRSSAYRKIGAIDKANEFDEQMINSAKNEHQKLDRIGRMHWANKRLKEADFYFSKAILIDDTIHWYYSARAAVRAAAKNYNGALLDITKAINLKPDARQHYVMRFSIYNALGLRESAQKDLNTSSKLDYANKDMYE